MKMDSCQWCQQVLTNRSTVGLTGNAEEENFQEEAAKEESDEKLQRVIQVRNTCLTFHCSENLTAVLRHRCLLFYEHCSGVSTGKESGSKQPTCFLSGTNVFFTWRQVSGKNNLCHNRDFRR